jgi:hypothetical protein
MQALTGGRKYVKNEMLSLMFHKVMKEASTAGKSHTGNPRW